MFKGGLDIFLRKDISFNHKLKIDWPKNEGILTTLKCAVLVLKGGYGLEAPPRPLRGIGVDDDLCMSCYGCVNICPKKAIHGNNKAFINLFKNAEGIRNNRREPLILI